MTVLRKMSSDKKTETDKMIAKGGEILKKNEDWIKILLPLMPKVVERIDRQRERGVPRVIWIRQAIQEKLKRDEENGDLI